MKYQANLNLDSTEALFLYNLLKERFLLLQKQRPELTKKKFDLIRKIIINHRTIIKGDQPGFFGLVTQTVDKVIQKNKILYKEMIEIEDAINHNEFIMETQLLAIIEKIKSEFELQFSEVKYTPIEVTTDYKHIRKYSLVSINFPEDFKDEDYINIISRYSPFRFR
jgi:hypothetical protein